MTENYQLLLAEAARLHERHEVTRPESFNVFSVLRSESDEVNLHSRFLVALLDHVDPNEAQWRNLESFLKRVANVEAFSLQDVVVSRERYNIDILVTNGANQALIVENKIWAGDQETQLQRYFDEMMRQGYRDENIFLRYLTPFGHDPSKKSLGNLPKERVENVAYRDEDFHNWLRHCQRRAYDQPALRESIAQYLRVVQKLTGTDYSEAYMNELRDLCLKDENLVLIKDLEAARTEAWISLIRELMKEIEAALDASINDLPEKHKITNISEARIRKLVTGRENTWSGLYYAFRDEAQLGVQIDTWDRCVFFGVRCVRENSPDPYDEIKKTLNGPKDSSEHWPWWKYPATSVNPNPRYPDKEHLRLLANEEKRQRFVANIVDETRTLWERIKAAGLVPRDLVTPPGSAPA